MAALPFVRQKAGGAFPGGRALRAGEDGLAADPVVAGPAGGGDLAGQHRRAVRELHDRAQQRVGGGRGR
ncbi:hypothetical protein AB0E83_31385, partial [Streptomyces sp. NPDC035033]|uniref:hypothetical protein n=1 Tax=Streptomyces sp. NPDC035033 TaxID=3155368 RepID=UPI0033F1DC84